MAVTLSIVLSAGRVIFAEEHEDARTNEKPEQPKAREEFRIAACAARDCDFVTVASAIYVFVSKEVN